jgi:hypothetical protein
MTWPLQRDCLKFYGDPFSKDFERRNIVQVKLPFPMFWGAHMKTTIKSHRKCAEALGAWLDQVWLNAGKKQFVISAWGMSSFSGDFVVRTKRGGSTPSMHSFGCAWDFDAPRNGFKDHSPHFATEAIHDAVVKPFLELGGVWGGDWKTNTDGMHFQFARVS